MPHTYDIEGAESQLRAEVGTGAANARVGVVRPTITGTSTNEVVLHRIS